VLHPEPTMRAKVPHRLLRAVSARAFATEPIDPELVLEWWLAARPAQSEITVASRPIWNGHLKLSLVSCAVSLFSATTQAEKISFHMLNKATGNRLRQQYIDEVSQEIVDREDRIRGYEVSDETYVTVTEEELDKVEIASTHMIDVDRFVEVTKIDRTYFDDCFFVAPDDEVGADAFAVIRDAMQSRGVVGIGRIVMYRRERPILLEPRGNGILATTLRYNYEVKDDRPFFATVGTRAASEEMVDLAGYIIDKKLGEFDPVQFEDRYQNALADLIAAKQAGQAAPTPPRLPKPSNVVNLMDALKASLASETKGGAINGRSQKPETETSASKKPGSKKSVDKAIGPDKGQAKPGARPARKAS
jgi:DNA end-binding protein Ku